MSDVETRFHETWLGMVQPIEGLLVSVPVLVDAQCMQRQPPESQKKLLELCQKIEDSEEELTLVDFKQFLSDILGLTPELYDVDGYPVDGGLMDLRLGAIDPGVRCRTCGGRLKECLGHPGIIELARPAVHIKYLPIIDLVLRSTCEACGKVLLKEDKDLSKSRRCLFLWFFRA